MMELPRMVFPSPDSTFDFDAHTPSLAGSPSASSHHNLSLSHSPSPNPFDFNPFDNTPFLPMPTLHNPNPGQVTWIEHTYAPQPPGSEALLEPPARVQTHGNRDFISASFEHGQKLGKPSGACTRCKKLKMKCELRSGEAKCQRCKGGDYDCIPARRRPRRPRVNPVPSPGQLKRIHNHNPANVSVPPEDDDATEGEEDDSDEPRLPAKTSPMGMIARMATTATGIGLVKGEDTASESTTIVGPGDEMGIQLHVPAMGGMMGIGSPSYFQGMFLHALPRPLFPVPCRDTTPMPQFIAPTTRRAPKGVRRLPSQPHAALRHPHHHPRLAFHPPSHFPLLPHFASANQPHVAHYPYSIFFSAPCAFHTWTTPLAVLSCSPIHISPSRTGPFTLGGRASVPKRPCPCSCQEGLLPIFCSRSHSSITSPCSCSCAHDASRGGSRGGGRLTVRCGRAADSCALFVVWLPFLLLRGEAPGTLCRAGWMFELYEGQGSCIGRHGYPGPHPLPSCLSSPVCRL
ncbi:hypothetical protein EXIGLDRAFT_192160 [Exidia glandulosa HHB12029]|uniref:Zn(2)-C6 fungal-type domain-containing protein n=1 Tax=Exidia glandulosa HHB12029 TaxID=1314781 RepID=A0A165EXS2_EXIGL|nr:hypothetical protein EXIGLDRAFT_192160 [Exidia glandulosa HHB12029]